MHSSTISLRLKFSMAAATLSLSLICLLTSPSIEWVPSFTKMSNLKFLCKVLSSLTLRQSPIRVASEQWGTVGVNCTLIQTSLSSSSKFADTAESAVAKGCCRLDASPPVPVPIDDWLLWEGLCWLLGEGGWVRVMSLSLMTFSSSKVCGCSGSLMSRIKSAWHNNYFQRSWFIFIHKNSDPYRISRWPEDHIALLKNQRAGTQQDWDC